MFILIWNLVLIWNVHRSTMIVLITTNPIDVNEVFEERFPENVAEVIFESEFK